MMTPEIQKALSRTGAPVTNAWQMFFDARGEVSFDDQPAGLLTAATASDWSPRLRTPAEARERLLVMSHLSRSMDALGDGEVEEHLEALKRFFALEVPLSRLEHIELFVIQSVVRFEAPHPEAATQMFWRGVAAGTLGWALGIFEYLDEGQTDHGELSAGFEGHPVDTPLPTENPRSLDEVRDALAICRAELARKTDPRARSPWVEQVKALRWLTEPWWPELSLVPWREGDTLNPKRI